MSSAEAFARFPGCALVLSVPFLLVNLLDGFTKPALAQTPLLFWIYDVTKWVLLPAATVFAMRMWCGASLSSFGLRGPDVRWLSALSVLYTVLAMSYFAFRALALQVIPEEPSFDLAELLPGGWARLPVVLYLCATAAFVEEFFYRGVMLEALAPAGSGPGRSSAYVLASSILFGLSHFENGSVEIFATGLFGVVAAVFALRIRNLWPLIAGHFATDFLAFQ